MSEISQVYLKHLFTNKNIKYLFCKEIIEYDMSSAGFNLSKEYKLLDNNVLTKLENMTKKERQYQLGWYQRKDKVFAKALTEAFVDMRRRFFEANNIQDEDILSIKKDAIFCTRSCEVTKFNNVEFKEKNIYTSYMLLADCELYYNHMKIDVKGIDDEVLLKHNDYMMKYIAMCFKHFETSSKETQLRFMRRFIDKYKSLDLELGYYRQFDRESLFISDDMMFDDYWEFKKDELDISYNFFKILVPLVHMAI